MKAETFHHERTKTKREGCSAKIELAHIDKCCLFPSLAAIISESLNQFAEFMVGYPPNLDPKEWHDKIIRMRDVFKKISEDAEVIEEYDEAMEDFSNYFLDLWV